MKYGFVRASELYDPHTGERQLQLGELDRGDGPIPDGGQSVGDTENELPPLLERMKPYADVKGDAREIHDWVGEIEQDLETLQWMAAGGLGMTSRESVIEKIDAQIRNLQALREQVEDLEDPRELGEEARSLHTETDREDSDD